jgi:nucleoside-diphosphate-sugar epimerase
MADSFTLSHPLHPASVSDKKRRVLVTGAAGNIGSYFALHAEGRYDLRLLCHERDDPSAIRDVGEVTVADVTDLDACKRACEGMDVVLHLAADPSPGATWDHVFHLNIGGTYNVFAAAKARGVKRVVFASSIHAVSGYPRNRQVHADDPVNPGDLYGVSKCFGEAMGRYMAEKEGVACIAVRIGAFQPVEKATQPGSAGLVDAFVSRRDLNQLLQKSVEADHIRWAVVHGLSRNSFNRMDIVQANELLGYEPQDDLTDLNPKFDDLDLSTSLTSHSITDPDKSGLRADV